MAAADGSPAQMIRQQRRLEARGECFELHEMSMADAVGGAERQAHTVQAERVVLAYALEQMQRLTAAAEEVLAVDLEPADIGSRFEQFAVVGRTQADASAGRELVQVDRAHGHVHPCGSPLFLNQE